MAPPNTKGKGGQKQSSEKNQSKPKVDVQTSQLNNTVLRDQSSESQDTGTTPIASKPEKEEEVKKADAKDGELKKLKQELEQAKKEAEAILRIKEDAVKKLKQESSDLQKRLENEKKEAKEQSDVLRDKLNRWILENNKLKEQNKKNKEKHETTLKEKDDEIKKRENTLKGKEEDIKKLKQETADLNTKLQKETNSAKDYSDELLEAKKTILQLEDKFNKENESLTKQNQRIRETYETIVEGRDDAIKKLNEETSDLKTRLSKIAGEKMTAGNSDISDLSDTERPMKLGERFGSLYDDEWTDAHEYLTETMNKSPDESIHYLLEVLKDCYNHCIKTAETQLESITNMLLFPDQSVSTQPDSPKMEKEISKQSKHRLLSVRRSISSMSIQLVNQKYLSAKKKSVHEDKEKKAMLEGCMPYYQKCIDICWLMVLHDPPMYISFDIKKGDHIDKDLFRTYGNLGDVCQFMVWPPLLVEKNGGVLSKGVVQPIKSEKTSGSGKKKGVPNKSVKK